MMGWLRAKGDGCVLRVRVVPGAKRDGLAGIHDGALRVRVAAPPVDGAANERLVKFLARKVLGVPRSQVRIIRGQTARKKDLAVDLTASEVGARLSEAGLEIKPDPGSV